MECQKGFGSFEPCSNSIFFMAGNSPSDNQNSDVGAFLGLGVIHLFSEVEVNSKGADFKKTVVFWISDLL